jgi:two-component system, chemotaxis family, protein-glutamate methylesterase/glutaminase
MRMDGHDIVAIGASAGGVAAVRSLLRGLPKDFPAAIFVVIHVSPHGPSALPRIFSRAGPLPARHPADGEPIRPETVYVAPPDRHLLIRPGRILLSRGPQENHTRPAVDPLFRSAALAYGPRVIGVVLTGYLDCGTAGLLSIKARGGVAIVQDPRDAEVPEMPASAIRHATVDHVAALRDIPALLGRLVEEPAAPWPKHLVGTLAEVEGDEPGVGAEIVCPICQGRLTETHINGYQMFRCHVGHAFSLESVAAEQAEEVERALWSAARALEESATLSARLATTSRGELRHRFAEREQTQIRDAELIRQILLSGGTLRRTDAGPPDEAAIAAEPDEPVS